MKTYALILLAALAITANAENLFNGKDLSGWDGNPELWSVQDGVIVGETTADKPIKGNTFLIWKGGDIKDFTFTIQARVTGNNNSGVQYRSRMVDPKAWVVGGYQMDMHPAPNYFSMLYEEKGRGIVAQRGQQVKMDAAGKRHEIGILDKSDKLDITQWNTYKIKAMGNRTEHFVNGKLTMRLIDEDPKKRSLSGLLALQLHAGKPMRVEFRHIRLSKKNIKDPAAAPLPARTKKTSKSRTEPKQKPQANAASNRPVWIWTSKPAKTETIYARRQWTLSADPKPTRLTITCDNGFTAFINGQKVAASNAWEKTTRVDITKHLRRGDNVIAVECTNEGSMAGLVAQIVSAGSPPIVTNAEWFVSSNKHEGWMAPSADTTKWQRPVIVGKLGDAPWGAVFSKKLTPKAKPKPSPAPAAKPKVADGFSIEKIYDVPKATQGSWVSMAVDDKGRLYCGDQDGQGIFRLTLAEKGTPKIEKLPAQITGAQGLLWAFDSLYVCLNGGKPGSGLYRLTDSNGDDQLDKVTELRRFQGGGEHGPHAIVLAPDGKSLFVLGGNHTKPPSPETSAVPTNYGEDQLLPRSADARGHASKINAPGGWVAQIDPDGKNFHLYAAGFRNQYDIAFNPDGEMFTFDSDMEYDIGSPWYRPTRIYHVTSGSEFGWRNGTGKFPAWYPDVLPPALDVGPGSPTGVVSGIGAKFPTKYQSAIYAFDWTYGTIYAMHPQPQGASYTMEKEEFVVGIPLPVTDGVIGKDGNFYFAVGGRGTQSALYKVTYTGKETTTTKPSADQTASADRQLRREMEALQGKQIPGAIDKLWPNLGHEDRHIRYAARVALEHQPLSDWHQRAVDERDPQTSLSALLALSRQGGKDYQDQLLDALSQLPASQLTEAQKLELLRVMGLSIIRMGKPSPETAAEITSALSPYYPSASDLLNREIVAMLVTLGDPSVVAKTVPLMSQDATTTEGLKLSDEFLKRSARYGGAFAQTQESNPQRQQIWYAYALKNATTGWTPELHRQFFTWFARSRNFKGGASFSGFLENFRKEALENITDPKLRAEMDALSKKPIALIPEGYEKARKIRVGTKIGMKFDIEQLAAKPGEKLAIELVNTDPTGLMHNLVVCTPGSLAKVNAAALTIGPDAMAKNFIPEIPEVLAATPQVSPGRKYTLYLTVPQNPGDYPYVCTYPGHGQLMHGVLKVSE